MSSSSQAPEPPQAPKKVERKWFSCADCGLNEEYSYFGRQPPFCRALQFHEPSYLAQDPFSASGGNNANFLLLGSNCAACGAMTCQQCSVYFSQRLCAECYRKCGNQLPEELAKAKKKEQDKSHS